MKKTLISAIVAVIMLLQPNIAYAQYFSDVQPNNSMGDSIISLYEKGYISGYPDGTFGISKKMNRAEFCVVITKFLEVESEGLEEYTTTNFSDMKGYGWAVPYVSYCFEKGIVSGDGKGNFMPGRTITYNEICTILVRVLGYEEKARNLTRINNIKYPQNYLNIGTEIGIFDGIILNDGQEAMRGIVAILVNNAYKYKEPGSYALINVLPTGNYEKTRAILESGAVVNESHFERLKELRAVSYSNSNYVKLAEYAELEDLLLAYKTKEAIDTGEKISAYDLQMYLNVFKNEIVTPVTTLSVTYEINEQEYIFDPYDLEIKIMADIIPYYDLAYSARISEKDKAETIQILRDFSKNIYEITSKSFSGKKIVGGYYSDFYKYPNLQLGLETTRGFSWKTFSGNIHDYYEDTQLTKFHWYPEYDDYQF
jgi:hypothetical protein